MFSYVSFCNPVLISKVNLSTQTGTISYFIICYRLYSREREALTSKETSQLMILT